MIVVKLINYEEHTSLQILGVFEQNRPTYEREDFIFMKIG